MLIIFIMLPLVHKQSQRDGDRHTKFFSWVVMRGSWSFWAKHKGWWVCEASYTSSTCNLWCQCHNFIWATKVKIFHLVDESSAWLFPSYISGLHLCEMGSPLCLWEGEYWYSFSPLLHSFFISNMKYPVIWVDESDPSDVTMASLSLSFFNSRKITMRCLR